jgi:hypothetical protein
MELGNADVWTAISSGVLVTARADNPQDDPQDRWDGVHAIGDSSLTRLMEANDPRDTIARCEFELAVLDEHAIVRVGYKDSRGIDRLSCECATCGLCGPPDSYPCQTVRLLGCGYRFRPGYREAEWKP